MVSDALQPFDEKPSGAAMALEGRAARKTDLSAMRVAG